MKIERTRTARRNRILGGMKREEQPVHLQNRLGSILTDLARILICSGYGMPGFAKLIKRAYFDAAAELSGTAGRRANFSQIAAITGLTRTEVSQLSQLKNATDIAKDLAPVNRAQRVSRSWITDEDYCDSRGQPHTLPFAGKHRSFEELAKRYSGDIPARAMLSEMVRLGMVTVDAKRNVRLVRVDTPIARQTTTSLRALSPWTSFLSNIEKDIESELKANAVHISLCFESLPQLFAAVRQLQSRTSALIESARELGAQEKRSKPHRLEVSFVLGTRVSSHSSAAVKKPRKIRS